MFVTFEKLDEISDGHVDYYSAKFEGNKLTEFERFDAKDFPNHLADLELIYGVIVEMGIKKARKFFFRHEGNADALPNNVPLEIIDANEADFGLRLYCIRISDDIVILLNGDIKTARDPNDCPNVGGHFKRARKIARLLDQARADNEINFQNPNPFKDFEIEI